jgi:large subunit ribosomal protein L4
MAKLDLYTLKGKVEGSVEGSDRVFGAERNDHVVSETLTWYLASQRQGNASTKNRGDVSGGGRKPWKQKGTGRARAGDNRMPHWRGGGVAFGPKPRDYSYSLPIKIRKAAIRVVLSDKAKSGNIRVVDKIDLASPKTKEMVKFLKGIGVLTSAVIVLPQKDEAINRVSSNIKGIKVLIGQALNVFDLLKANDIVIIKDAIPVLEEAYK